MREHGAEADVVQEDTQAVARLRSSDYQVVVAVDDCASELGALHFLELLYQSRPDVVFLAVVTEECEPPRVFRRPQKYERMGS